ncbi:AAA family ATPase [Haliangium sp.]|uniref:AAA family ATPase n=1 Tax=Haliangium sp. TaxID=2663208 RepID=UPI003D0F18F2
MDAYRDTLDLVRAGAKVLHIASYEWERVQGWAIALAQRELQVPLWCWSSAGGLIARDGHGRREPIEHGLGDPIEAIERLCSAEDGAVLLLEDIHPYLEPQHHQVTRRVREVCRLPQTPPRLLLLSTPTPTLPLELRKEVPTVELPLPDHDALSEVLVAAAADLSVSCTNPPEPALLDAARGLTVMEARLAYGRAALAAGRLDQAAVAHVMGEKKRVIRQSGVLEYYEPDAGMDDVGGLNDLKTWLDRRGRAFGPGAREYGLDTPKGVLLLGVQGCGKSLMAKAVAAAWQFPLLRFDMGKVFGGIVGESEGNMRMAVTTAEALAPCVLWIDEIEKGLAGMGSSDRSDGGTTARVVGTLLTWMQERRAPVFVVATANRIDLLPPELLRKGRFDEIFFVDLPTAPVRAQIMAIHLRKKGRDPQDFDLDALATASVGYAGAELEEAVREALFTAFDQGVEVKTGHIEQALADTYPLSRTMRAHIEDLRRWAQVRARLASDEPVESLPRTDRDEAPRLPQEGRNPFIPKEQDK